jgi:hypothetical protein
MGGAAAGVLERVKDGGVGRAAWGRTIFFHAGIVGVWGEQLYLANNEKMITVFEIVCHR